MDSFSFDGKRNVGVGDGDESFSLFREWLEGSLESLLDCFEITIDGGSEDRCSSVVEEDNDIIFNLESCLLLGLLDAAGQVTETSLVLELFVLLEIEEQDEFTFTTEFQVFA